MKYLITLLFISSSYSQTLKVELDKIPEEEGKAMLALYNSETNYDEEDKPFKHLICERKNFEAKSCQFEKLEKGTYSLAIFWDQDGDKELDTNFVGYPSEDFGFSQNPTIIAGKPSYDSTKFDYDGSDKTLKIELK